MEPNIQFSDVKVDYLGTNSMEITFKIDCRLSDYERVTSVVAEIENTEPDGEHRVQVTKQDEKSYRRFSVKFLRSRYDTFVLKLYAQYDIKFKTKPVFFYCKAGPYIVTPHGDGVLGIVRG